MNIDTFKAAANVTHPIYGNNSVPATVDILKNLIMVNNITIQRATIMVIPQNGD